MGKYIGATGLTYLWGKIKTVFAAKATTLSGYGITDAKIASGTITLGSNSITPITSHQSLTDYVQKSNTSGLLKNDGTVDTSAYVTAATAPVTSVNGETGAVTVSSSTITFRQW